jgi:hypothetical protein
MNQSSGKRQSPEHRNYKESMRVWKNMNLELLLKKDLTTECLDLIAQVVVNPTTIRSWQLRPPI